MMSCCPERDFQRSRQLDFARGGQSQISAAACLIVIWQLHIIRAAIHSSNSPEDVSTTTSSINHRLYHYLLQNGEMAELVRTDGF